jgi:hypothetical protein
MRRRLPGLAALLLFTASAALVPSTRATANEASPDTIRAAIARRLAIPGNVLRTAPEAWAGKAAAFGDALAHGGTISHAGDPQAVSKDAVVAKAVADAAGKAAAAKLAAATRPTGKEGSAEEEAKDAAEAAAASGQAGDAGPPPAPSPTSRPPPPPTVAFWGAGGLIVFYAGVVQGLQDAGVLTPDTVYAGLSSGGLTAVLTALGMPGRDQAALAAQMAGVGIS